MEDKIPWIIGAIVLIVIVIALNYSFGRMANDNLESMASNARNQSNQMMQDAADNFGKK